MRILKPEDLIERGGVKYIPGFSVGFKPLGNGFFRIVGIKSSRYDDISEINENVIEHILQHLRAGKS